MKNKKLYAPAEIEVVDLSKNDIIRTSGELPGINLPDIELSGIYGDNSNVL